MAEINELTISHKYPHCTLWNASSKCNKTTFSSYLAANELLFLAKTQKWFSDQFSLSDDLNKPPNYSFINLKRKCLGGEIGFFILTQCKWY